MADRKKVIRGLEACSSSGLLCPGKECPYNDHSLTCKYVLMRDALALLREQEPRVLSWDELMRCADGDPAFIETRDRSCCWMLIHPMYMGMNDKNGYGVRWRYWTSRPTPEQMRDTPWEGENDAE